MFATTIHYMKKLILLPIILAALTVTAQTNYALDLNGTNQYVSIGAPIASSSSYTKEAWVNLPVSAGARNIISSSNHPFWINGGILSAGQAGNYSLVTDPVTFPLNRWVHVAVTYDAPTTTMRLYRDGILISTNASVPAYMSENNFIASHTGGNSLLQGKVDEVRIWGIALTASQLKANLFKGPANNASGLLSYYKCNDGTGTSLTNATGAADGILHNAPAWVASEVQSGANALHFDGVNDVVNIADNNTLDITNAITLEAWVYATKNTGIQNVICKSSGAPNTGYIFPRTDNGWTNIVVYLHIAGGWRTLSAPYGLLNAWHHLAATYDGAEMRLYIDGALAASQAQTGAIAVNANVVALGNQTGTTEFFGGMADEIRIWNVARTQLEIQASMNSELNPEMQTGLVSYFTLNQGIANGVNPGMTIAIDQKSSNNGELVNFALNGAASNFVTQNSSLVTLPVEWLSFTAQLQADAVVLKWSTASEDNTKNFVVQWKSSAAWKNIGVVEAAGSSNTVRDYSYVHEGPVNGVNYYRILQTDIDGRSSYSGIRSVRITSRANVFTIINNPVDDGVLRFKADDGVDIAVYSSDGRLILRQPFKAGVNHIDVSQWVKGLYWVNVGDRVEKILVR